MGDGRGTPWGPMQSGDPGELNLETDPSKFKGFDYSQLKQQMLEDLALQGGDAQRQMLAGTSKALGSGTMSGSTLGRLSNLAAQTQKNQGRVSAEMAMREWQDKKDLMDSYNRAREASHRAKQDRFGAEQGGRGAFWQGMGNVAGGALGGWLGGRGK